MSPAVKIAWRNLWRNPRRTLLTTAALAFSSLVLIFMMSWQHGAYQAMISSAVNLQTGPLQVLAGGYQANPDIRKVIREPGALLARLDKMPGVRAAAPRAEAFALVSSPHRSQGVMIVAVDPAREPEVTTLGRTVREGAFLGSAPDGAVIGSRLARNLQVGIGGELVVIGQGYDGGSAAEVVHVTGILDTGQPELDRSLMLVVLSPFQDAFGLNGAVHRIVVEPADFGRLDEVRAALLAQLPRQDPPLTALAWDSLLPGLRQSILLDQMNGYVMYAILLVVVTFSIANTFLMAVLERIHEFGVLRAIGTTPGRLSAMLLLESAFLAGVGIALGILLGVALSLVVQHVGIPMREAGAIMKHYGLPDRLYTRLTWTAAFAGPAFVFAVTAAAALLPALRVRRLKLVAALNAP